MVFVGGRKRIKDIKTPVNKKKRPAASAVSSEDESRAEVVKTPKSTKKQKVIQEKETRKTQKVISSFVLITNTYTHKQHFGTNLQYSFILILFSSFQLFLQDFSLSF